MAVRTSRAGYAFSGLRLLQILLLVCVLPLLAMFMVRLDRLDAVPPFAVLFSLVAVLLALAYFVPTAGMHLVGRWNSYSTFVVGDAVFLALLVVAAVVLGAPLRTLDCAEVARRGLGIDSLAAIRYDGDGSARLDAARFGALDIGALSLPAVGETYQDGLRTAHAYEQWVGRVGGVCLQMKGAWVGTVVLDAVTAASVLVAALLRRTVRRLPEFKDEDLKADEDGLEPPPLMARGRSTDGEEGESAGAEARGRRSGESEWDSVGDGRCRSALSTV